MARTKNVRTIMLSDEIFNALKTAAMSQNTSVSKILEDLAREYLTKNSEEIQRALQRQMALFENHSDSAHSND